MSKVVSMRLKDDQVERLERAARRLGRSPSSAAALLLEESLRQSEFPYIEFRDSPVGRQAYIRGTRLTAWMVKWLIANYEGDVRKMAKALDVSAFKLEAGLSYAQAYPDEIADAIADNERPIEELRRLIPNIEVFEVDATSARFTRSQSGRRTA